MQKAWNAPETGTGHLRAPGACADCGGDAYIRMDAESDSAEMLCAHCYAERIRKEGITPEAPQAIYRISGIRSQ